MPRTLIPGRSLSFALLGALAAATGCSSEPEPFKAPPGYGIDVSDVAPPPISGGTLLITRADVAVASDPDRDLVWLTVLEDGAEARSIKLKAGDEPGRLVEDGDGKVHVALRRGGAVATIDPESGTLLFQRSVCPAPRGIAYDKAQDLLHVACEGGELVSLPAKGGEATRSLRLQRDLRDVIVSGDRLLVSRFRAAQLIAVNKDGTTGEPRSLPAFEPNNLPMQRYEPSVAWRTVAMPNGDALMLHQRSMAVPVTLAPGGYYQTAGCDGSILHAAVSIFRGESGQKDRTEIAASDAFPSVALPVDVAVAPDGNRIAMVGAGSDLVIQTRASFLVGDAGSGNCTPDMKSATVPVEPVAVAFSSRGDLVVQTRTPAILLLDSEGGVSATISLPGESRADTGHDMFHRPPNGFSGIACASCHPEGHDDGRTWTFTTGIGQGFVRRTQNVGIGGGLMGTAPFHWNGELSDLSALMNEVFVLRMGGTAPGPRKVGIFQTWLDQLPAMPPSSSGDDASIRRGKALFESSAVGCTSCHSGEKFTNNKTVDVGTGGELQVPSLISVGSRAPFMHTGCATSLRERFTNPKCSGGDKHGTTSQLNDAEITDLSNYLESL